MLGGPNGQQKPKYGRLLIVFKNLARSVF